jgi:hypothetical protein
MKSYLEKLGKALLTGTLMLGLSAVADAQQAPPASQQPMEIPAQYPPQPQGRPQSQGAPQPAPQNDPGAARISFIRGDVQTQHSGSSDWAAATVNTPVVSGDHISTGQNARAEIQLDHANILRLSDQSTANVVTMSRTQMQLQVGQGLANYAVFKNNEANVEIDTPNVAIRPEMGEGSYRILVNSDGETIVDVRKGSAEISTPQGSTRVERDQRITIQGTADSAQYQVSGAPGRDDWDKWNGDRDRTIEGAESWHHTNPNYTGSQDLDSYGHWSNVPDYGDVWFPSSDSGWAPYRDGRWVYEPYYGWTWVSYEPWGWAPYHYGRWFVYGGNWGWWPGPVYGGYYPVWAPAYVSFFGFGGGGFGVGVGFGFGGGFGRVGWLPCGPGDRFFPWYGRGVNRVNVVNVTNITNIHNNYGGVAPLREGTHAYSNVNRAVTDEHVRNGISSMQGSEFGHGRVPTQQSRIDAGSFRQASMMTGTHPVSPSHQSFQSTDRPVNPKSIPNRAGSNQHFFSSNARQNTPTQTPRNESSFNRGGSTTSNASHGPINGETSRTPQSSNQGQHSFNSTSTQQGQSIQSSRPGWRTFTPPSGRQTQPNGARTFESQGAPQSRPNYPQTSQPPRQSQNYSRGNSNANGSSRPTLNMQQPVVTPRGGGSYSGRPMPSAPSGGNYAPYRGGQSGGGSYSGRSMPSAPSGGSYGPSRGGPSGGGSYSGRPMPTAPSGGNYGGGGNRGGSPGGGSRGGNSGGGSRGGPSDGGHNRH